ncbi:MULTISPECIES: hypothetical protein [Thalassobacillus]|uniref:hypothetical protein n=1 Tax=Thalassobacillus TaxID=331971 RepID=UPI000A1CDC48|nr:hypothetical protein [Thalassobacillus devorans]
MLQNKRNILKLKEIRLDDQRISFQRACIERFDYEWVIEVINPAPSPSSEEDSFVTSISFIQEDGTQFDDVDIESFQLSSEEHENVYLFHMFPDEKQD